MLLQSTDTEDSGLTVLILPDFSLSELETLLDLVYRREARQPDRLMVSKLEDCLRLRDIDKENVCLFCYFRTSDLTPYMQRNCQIEHLICSVLSPVSCVAFR